MRAVRVRVELDTTESVLHDVYAFLIATAQGLKREDALPDHVYDLRAAAQAIRIAAVHERHWRKPRRKPSGD